jgi:hypothetical protein
MAAGMECGRPMRAGRKVVVREGLKAQGQGGWRISEFFQYFIDFPLDKMF